MSVGKLVTVVTPFEPFMLLVFIQLREKLKADDHSGVLSVRKEDTHVANEVYPHLIGVKRHQMAQNDVNLRSFCTI